MSVPAPEIPTLLLEPNENAPALARDFLATLFREWGSADDFMARLVVCELVTNAWRHGEGQIILRVFRDVRPDLVMIEVWDQGDGLPVVGPEDFEATSGRGLLLMSRVVDDWGTRPIAEGGKIVWARCAL
ncbi:ATP-binding protein [Actinomadura sp. NAK00032]|uniref:ATP-binding protein n=1 Tax=Actinomadura sp. NAK00032 TaxID=2742128 RepID=UPI0015901335|nr:ATP-binding protein [Actinomadura sp. NAK00032]QKW38013.1 ATP-binding protein [Actinomadura sp. NAK00032]